MKFLLFCIGVITFLSPYVVSAQSDEFLIRVLAGDDTTSPSDPVVSDVVPVTATQIDVSWSTSTDNWIFGGYVLLRDGTPIATTTQTSYNDTGLIPETEYSYSVYAFDAAGNLSSTSATVSTTTLALPVAPTSTPAVETGDTTSTKTVVLRDLAIVPSGTSALISWSTNISTRFTFRWGRTDAYTGGYISNEIYAKTQVTELQGLEPGTVYLYELIGYSPAGIAVTLKRGQFSTVAEVSDRVIANVERLTAEVRGDDVLLNYAFPQGESGARVRIVRSHLGFPGDAYDGAVIYEGEATTFRDVAALQTHGTQYYTVFVIGRDGTISSGAVVVARRFSGTAAGHGGGATSSSLGDFTAPEVLLPLLQPNDIVITQLGRVSTFLSPLIELSPRETFTIRIAKEALPPHLKSIIVTLLDPTDQRRSYTFLLRINKAGTAYEATIAPVAVLGVSRVQVEVFDYETEVVGRYRVQVNFVPGLEAAREVVFPDAFIKPFGYFIPAFGFVFFIFLLCILIAFYRRRAPEDKT